MKRKNLKEENIKKERELIIIPQKKKIIEQKINQKEEDNLIDIVVQVEEKKLPKVEQVEKVHGVKIQKI